MEMDLREDEIIRDSYEDELMMTLELEDGTEMECIVLAIFSLDDTRYNTLAASHQENDNDDEDDEDDYDEDDGEDDKTEIPLPNKSQQYIALTPVDQADDEDGDIFLYAYSEDDNGQPILGDIEDDDLFDAVCDRFDEICDEEDFDELVPTTEA